MTILVVSSMAFVFVALPVPASATSFGPDCIPCPGGGRCYPDCGSPTITLLVSTSAESTNVTLTFVLNLAAYVTLVWGNTTAYAFTELNHQYEPTGRSAVFIDFLEPDTAYYYRATATMTGDTPASRTGSFATSADSVSYFSGSVRDVNGNSPPPSEALVIEANCASNPLPGLTGYNLTVYAWTGASGTYSFNSLPTFAIVPDDVVPCGSAGYAVEALSGFVPGYIWTGHWNETVITFAPQVIHFILSLNFVTQPIVQIADFSNANLSNGLPDSNVGYSDGTTYTTSSSHCWTMVFVMSNCSSTSTEVGTGIAYSAYGHNLVVTQRFYESGIVAFDGFSREWSVPSEIYYQGYAPPVNEPASWPIQDTMVPGNSSLYLLYAWGGQWQKGVLVYVDSADRGWVTVSSTSTSYQVKGFSVGIGVDIRGVDVGTTVLSDQWSQTSSSTASNTLSWTVYGNSETVPVCYVVYGVGGSSSSSSTTADAIGIWGYAPTYSAGAYGCPLPA